MSDFRTNISKKLKEERPNITDQSTKTYASTLYNLNKKMEGKHELDFFNNHEEIIKFINEKIPSKQTKKTLLSALYILTKSKEYHADMITICKQVNDSYKEQKLTDKQKEHRISFDEVKDKVDLLRASLKIHKTKEAYELFLIAAFSSGVYSPPRRAEFANIKVRNYDKTKDNFLHKNTIIFNSFKTVKKFGSQEYKIAPELLPILKKYLTMNTSDFLFPKQDGKTSMTNVDYNRACQRAFGKNISVDALRSIYLSNKYKDVPAMLDMEKTAIAMGHSVGTALTDYVKKE